MSCTSTCGCGLCDLLIFCVLDLPMGIPSLSLWQQYAARNRVGTSAVIPKLKALVLSLLEDSAIVFSSRFVRYLFGILLVSTGTADRFCRYNRESHCSRPLAIGRRYSPLAS